VRAAGGHRIAALAASAGRSEAPTRCANGPPDVEYCMARKQAAVDTLLDSLVWMRRKAKKHEAVDDLIDALMKMRRRVKKKTAKKKSAKKKSAKKKTRKGRPKA
jgi:hypothetical protein